MSRLTAIPSVPNVEARIIDKRVSDQETHYCRYNSTRTFKHGEKMHVESHAVLQVV
jgi:hypothetical protein